VPSVHEPGRFTEVIAQWPRERRLLLCDESGAGEPIASALARERGRMPQPWAVLVGPEGGFSPAEFAGLRACEAAVPVSLGERLLRADTAALAALATWQALLGEWQHGRKR
jgi:16S rRNA (uracil1498-N3)-methyltransferase